MHSCRVCTLPELRNKRTNRPAEQRERGGGLGLQHGSVRDWTEDVLPCHCVLIGWWLLSGGEHSL